MKQIVLPTAIILAALMAIAALPIPSIEYYKFLRFITLLGSGVIIYYFYSIKEYFWIPFLMIVFILFNPISPFHLGREVWVYANLLAAGFFSFISYKLMKK